MSNDIHVLSRAVILDAGHILMAYDPRPSPYHYYELGTHFYYLPGGHVEFKESAEAALLREIDEEIGTPAQIERFLGVYEHAWHFPGDKVCCHTHEINLTFKVICPLLSRDSVPLGKEDHIAFEWVPLQAIGGLRPVELKRLIPYWLEYDLKGAFKSSLH